MVVPTMTAIAAKRPTVRGRPSPLVGPERVAEGVVERSKAMARLG
jgi:hypothetical protein